MGERLTSLADAPGLPSLNDMRDTLQFMWLHFLERLVEEQERPRRGAARMAAEWNRADVEMTVKTYRTTCPESRGEQHKLVSLVVRGPAGAFRLEGAYNTDPSMQDLVSPIAWHAAGDHEALCEWMAPWVARHIAEGDGYLDV